MNPNDTLHFTAGILESSAMIYPSALVVKTRHQGVKRELKAAYGGSIEPGRWVLKSVPKRRTILEGWSAVSPWRRTEIEAALDSLGSA